VLLTHWSARDADAWIGGELQRLRAFGGKVDWPLFAGAAQAGLAAKLACRGLVASSTTWLIADLTELPEPPVMRPELRVAVVPAEMDDWRRGFAAGFAVTDAIAQYYHDSYVGRSRQSALVQDRIHCDGYVDDAPVATAMLLCTECQVPELRFESHARS
jgi:hypothetical protein